MPVHHKKYDLEAGEDLSPDIACSSRPHQTRFSPLKKQTSNNAKSEENTRKNENTKALTD